VAVRIHYPIRSPERERLMKAGKLALIEMLKTGHKATPAWRAAHDAVEEVIAAIVAKQGIEEQEIKT